jgi:hypothetical protein
MLTIRSVLSGFTLAWLAFALAGCSSNPAAATEPVDPAGVWTFRITVTEATDACDGEEGESSAHPITITRTGSAPPYSIVARGFLGDPNSFLTGTFDANNRLVIAGSYPEDGGTTSSHHDLVATSQNRMEGIETWNWTDGNGSCPGSKADVVATRVP